MDATGLIPGSSFSDLMKKGSGRGSFLARSWFQGLKETFRHLQFRHLVTKRVSSTFVSSYFLWGGSSNLDPTMGLQGGYRSLG